MVVDKIRREEIDQGEATRQISEFYPLSRSSLNRFINHNQVRNPRQLVAIARWLDLMDKKDLIAILQEYNFLPGLDEFLERRLTIEYRLNAIRKELESLTSLLKRS